MRDSEEYATLTRQVYRLAGEAVTRAANSAGAAMGGGAGHRRNDARQLDLSARTRGLRAAVYDKSWDAWVERREASPVPGVADFIAQVRRAGGHVGWI